MSREIFFSIINWLHSQNAVFGIDHIVIYSRIFWLDSEKDLNDLYELYLNNNSM